MMIRLAALSMMRSDHCPYFIRRPRRRAFHCRIAQALKTARFDGIVRASAGPRPNFRHEFCRGMDIIITRSHVRPLHMLSMAPVHSLSVAGSLFHFFRGGATRCIARSERDVLLWL